MSGVGTITRQSRHSIQSASAAKVCPSAVNVVLVAAVALAFGVRPAFAYVDPSVVTYTIQALAAVAVALSAVAGVAFRRTRGVFMKLLGIDEDAGKIEEPEVSRIDPAAKAAADAAAVESFAAAKRPAEEKPLIWRTRFFWALLASGFLCLTVLIVSPVEIVASSASSLTFGLADVWWLILGSGVAAAVLLALVVSALRGRAFRVAIAVICAVGVCAWLQAIALNKGLPVADGRAVPWHDYTTITVISAAVWVCALAVAITLALRVPKVFRALATALCTLIAIIQVIGAASLVINPTGGSILGNPDTIVATGEGLYTVSSKDNVIVFILDTMDSGHILNQLEDDPNLLDDFKGFTYYADSTGKMIPTHNAIPTLLSGHSMADYGDYWTWANNMYPDSTFLDDMLDAGYELGIYSCESFWNNETGEYLAERTINIHTASAGEGVAPDPVGTIRILWRCSFYRGSTWLLKRFFWFYTDQLNNSMIADDASVFNESAPYTYDDARWYRNLQQEGLSVVEGGENGCFRLIHLLGSHEPFLIDEYGINRSPFNTTEEQQTKGSLLMVSDYLQMLRDLGLYDDATIIVTADHGEWYYTAEHLKHPSCPIMMIKPGGQTAEEAAADLVFSDVPVSHDDFQSTVLQAMGASDEVVSRYGTSILDLDDSPRIRTYITSRWLSYDNHREVMDEYEIDGYALDINNWEYTGRSWYGA